MGRRTIITAPFVVAAILLAVAVQPAWSATENFTIAIGDTVSPDQINATPAPGAGNIEAPGAIDVYAFEGSAGQHVFFDIQRHSNIECPFAGGQQRWVLERPDNTVVFDDSLTFCPNHDLTLDQTGTYRLTVRAPLNSTETGTYRFRILTVPGPQSFPIRIGDTVSPDQINATPAPGAGNIEAPGAIDVYTFEGSAGQHVIFDIQRHSSFECPFAGGQQRWVLERPDNTVVFDDSLTFCPDHDLTLDQTGTYRLTVRPPLNSDETGTYRFRVSSPNTTLQCGATITQDTTLTDDLVCPDTFTGAALTIGASSVRLDLAGHTIRAGANGGSFGILGPGSTPTRPLSQLVVLNGKIEGFDTGVSLQTVLSHVRKLTISATTKGIVMDTLQSAGGLLEDCQSSVTNCIVRNSVTITGDSSDATGIKMTGDGNHAWNNTVTGGAFGLTADGDKSRVALNTVRGCFAVGISVTNYTTYTIVWQNHTSASSTIGGCGIGVQAGDSGGNARVRRNVSSGSHNGPGISVYDRSALVALNESNGNFSDGITVTGPEGAANIVQDNTARDNGQYGINAPPGTIDGGGNTASGNGLQDCVNVTCTP